MVKLTLNTQIEELIKIAGKDSYETIRRRNWISHNDLIKLYQASSSGDDLDLVTLLKGSSVHIPPPPVIEEQSPEFKRQLEYLKLQVEEAEYQQLIASSSIPTYDAAFDSPSAMSKELRHQLTTIINIAISVASVGYAIWYWTGTSMRINNAYRVLLCLFFSILVLVAEVVVFNGYLMKIDEAKVTERKKQEVKKVVESVTFRSRGKRLKQS